MRTLYNPSARGRERQLAQSLEHSLPLNSLLSSAALSLFHCLSKTKSIPLRRYCSVFHRADIVSLPSHPCHSFCYPVTEKMSLAGSGQLWPAKINSNKLILNEVGNGYKCLASHLIRHRAMPRSKAVTFLHMRTEHPQTQAFFRPLSFSLRLTLKFSPRGEGFTLSSGICIYDENNCLSEMGCFFWEKRDSFFFKEWQ